MTADLPPTIDPVAARRWSTMAATSSPWLHEEVARRMVERLDWIRMKPTSWLHWDATRGGLQAHELISQRYPDARCHVIESADHRLKAAGEALKKPWWDPRRWTAGAIEFGPPPEGSVQMLWSNMGLHMEADPRALIERWHRALAVDGFLMFSCLGPDTLLQLRNLYRTLGWPTPAHAFTDMHDWGDMLVKAGFAEPVMDMERITLTYSAPQALLADLRGLGRNLHPARFAGLRTRAWRAQLETAIATHLEQEQGDTHQLALGFEVIYGHAFKPAARVRLTEQSSVPLEAMREMLRGSPVARPLAGNGEAPGLSGP